MDSASPIHSRVFYFMKDLFKVCTKCKEKKSVNDYHKQKKGKYGVTSVCKVCKSEIKKRDWKVTKNDKELYQVHKERVAEHYRKKSKDKKWMERKRKAQRKICRKDYARKYYNDNREAYRVYKKRTRKRYPEKEKARRATINMKIDGKHLHHWSYNEEHYTCVIPLSPLDHAKIYRFLIYDNNSFYFKDSKGNLLNTRNKHLEYINSILN